MTDLTLEEATHWLKEASAEVARAQENYAKAANAVADAAVQEAKRFPVENE